MEYCGCGDLVRLPARVIPTAPSTTLTAKFSRAQAARSSGIASTVGTSTSASCGALHPDGRRDRVPAREEHHPPRQTANSPPGGKQTATSGEYEERGLPARRSARRTHEPRDLVEQAVRRLVRHLGARPHLRAVRANAFVGDSFAQLQKGVLSGLQPDPQAVLDRAQARAHDPREPAQQPTIKQLLELPEVKSRRQADWFKGAAVPEKGDCNLMATIAVPANIVSSRTTCPAVLRRQAPQLARGVAATDRSREGTIATKKAGGGPCRQAENVAPASNAPKATGSAPTAKAPATHANVARPTAAPLPIRPKGPPRRCAPTPRRQRGAGGQGGVRLAATASRRVAACRPTSPQRHAGRALRRRGPRPRTAGARAATTSTAARAAAGYNRRRY